MACHDALSIFFFLHRLLTTGFIYVRFHIKTLCKETQKRARSVVCYLQGESVVQFTVSTKYSLNLKATFLEFSGLQHKKNQYQVVLICH